MSFKANMFFFLKSENEFETQNGHSFLFLFCFCTLLFVQFDRIYFIKNELVTTERPSLLDNPIQLYLYISI